MTTRNSCFCARLLDHKPLCPAKAGIQYSEAFVMGSSRTEFWIARSSVQPGDITDGCSGT